MLLQRILRVLFDENRSYKLDLNALEKPHLDASICSKSQISSKSLKSFESPKCV